MQNKEIDTIQKCWANVTRATHIVEQPQWDQYRPGVGGGTTAYECCERHIEPTIASNPYPKDMPSRVIPCEDGTCFPTDQPCGACFHEAMRAFRKMEQELS